MIFKTMNQKDHFLNKKKNSVMGLMKHDLCGKTMTKFAGLKSKIYRYLTNNSDENEKAKGTKMFFIKQKF